MTQESGPLPEPGGFSAGAHDGALLSQKRSTGNSFSKGARLPLCEWYTADQMRAYAAEQVAAERERWAKVCERVAGVAQDRVERDAALDCAGNIRLLSFKAGA